VARNKPAGVYLPVKNLHFIKDKKGVKVSARCGSLLELRVRVWVQNQT
jgi:hypothetical protein